MECSQKGQRGGYEDMDKVEKMDYRANGEAIFCAMSPLRSQGPNISDRQSIGLTGRKNGCPIHLFKPRATNCLDSDTRKMNNGKQHITN